MQYWILSSASNVIFVNSFCCRFNSRSRWLMCFGNATEFCLFLRCVGFLLKAMVSRLQVVADVLHMALQVPCCVSNYRLAFSNDVLVIFITWIDRINSCQTLACSSFGFSSAHSCFSFLLASFPILFQASGHKWSGRDVVWIFVSLPPGPHVSFGRFLFQWSKPRETCPRIRQISVSIDVAIIINSLILCDVQIWNCWPCDIIHFQWNTESCSCWHI